MRILVLGGSYFLGKCFVKNAKTKHDITVLNRGSRPLDIEGVEQICADRHDKDALSQLGKREFDVVVDFCAYASEDIKEIYEILNGSFKQYIFISTCDVYARGLERVLDENAEFEKRDFGGEAGAYILGKVALEQELKDLSRQYNNAYTSIRPAFIYGPYNYAPRESIYFQWIMQAAQIIHPVDATSEFQMVYVEDVAKAILGAIGNERAYNTAYNLASNMIDYNSFADALSFVFGAGFEQHGMPAINFTKVEVDVNTVNEKGIPLPFPLTKEESNWYDGSKALELIGEYTPLNQGLLDTALVSVTQSGQESSKTLVTYQDYVDEIERLFEQNRPKDAQKLMLDALAQAREDGDAAFELQMLNELIGYYRQTSEKDKLIEILEASIDVANRMRLMDTKQGQTAYATTALNVANGYRSIGELDKSLDYYELVEKIYNNILDEKDMLRAGLYNNMSLLSQERGDIDTALGLQLKALDIVMYHDAGFEIAVTYANLANTAFVLGNRNNDYSQSKAYAEEAIRRFIERNTIDAHFCAALSALGLCYYNEGNYEEARALFEKGMNIVENCLGQNSQYMRLKENRDMCVKKLDDI